MKLRLNTTGKLAFLLVLFSAALLGSSGVLAYASGRAGLQEAATSELLTRAIEKQAALEKWLSAARINVAVQAQSPFVAEQAAALLAAAPGSPQARAAHDQLVREFQPYADLRTEFTELLFIEAETGQVLASTDPTEEGKFKENQSYFINGKNAPYVSELYYAMSLGRPAMTAAAPVKTADGRLLGVLAGREDLGVLSELISRRSNLRQTDDAYLVNAAGLLVTQPRFISDPSILQKAPKTEAVKRCVEGDSGALSADDYRGVPALISYRWLPDQKMCLIVKIDQAEAFAPNRALARTIALAGGLVLVAAVALAIALARSFTHPILALQAGAARVGAGELDVRVPETGSDELGLLASEFNSMAEALQQRQVALSESEANYRSLVENTMVGVYKTNIAGELLYVNQALAHMLGFDSTEEMRAGGVVARYKNPETRLRLMDAVREAGRAESFEAEALTEQGQTKTILLNARLDGDTLSGMVVDITERKQAEEEIRRLNESLEQRVRDRTAELETANATLQGSNAFLDSLIENIPTMVFVKDAGDLRFARFNKAGEDLLGYSREDLLGKNDYDFFPKEQADFFVSKDREVLESGVVQDIPEEPIRTRHQGTRILHTRKISVRDAQGRPRYLLGISEDITEQKQAEEALREKTEEIDRFFSTALDLLCIADTDGYFRRLNPQWGQVLGYSMDELEGRRFLEFVHPDDLEATLQAMSQLDAQERVLNFVNRYRCKDGSYRHIEWRSSPRGKLIYAAARDITERRRAEESILRLNADLQQRKAQLESANKELEAFAYSVSHDLRAPLRSIDGFSQALLEDYGSGMDDQAREYALRVRGGAQRMGALIDDLLKLSRVTRTELRREAVDLSDLARQVLEELTSGDPGRRADVSIADGLLAEGDPRLLRVVLENLLGNAWKFTARQERPMITFSRMEQDGEAVFFVRDNGAGFDMAYAEKLFGAFQRLHSAEEFPGTGVGLATVQRIIHRHGGRVWAEAEVGNGATFYFTLP